MRYIFPVNLIPQAEGGFTVTFPDIPEAVSEGDDKAEALRNAADALIAALGGYIENRQRIPRASRPARGQDTVALDALLAAKLGLHDAMLSKGESNVELAKRLRIDERAVRRLLDLDHASKIEGIQEALEALGKRLIVEISDAAA